MCFLLHKRCEVLVQSLNTAGRKDLKDPRGSPRGFWGLVEGLPPPPCPSGLRQHGEDPQRQETVLPAGRPALSCFEAPFTVRPDLQPSLVWASGDDSRPPSLWSVRLCFEMTDKVINCKANSKKPLQTCVCLWICTHPGKPTENSLESSLALQTVPAGRPGGAGAEDADAASGALSLSLCSVLPKSPPRPRP